MLRLIMAELKFMKTVAKDSLALSSRMAMEWPGTKWVYIMGRILHNTLKLYFCSLVIYHLCVP